MSQGKTIKTQNSSQTMLVPTSNTMARMHTYRQHVPWSGDSLSGDNPQNDWQSLSLEKPNQHSVSPAIPAIVNEALKSPGKPLDQNTRDFMEPRFNHNFSKVLVHTDTKSRDSASTLGAIAYTFGRHIVFAHNRFSPNSRAGQSLLAHELTHVIQHRSHNHSVTENNVRVSSPHDPAENNAERVSRAIESGSPISPIVSTATNIIHRVPVQSHGGSWDTTSYTATNRGAGVGKVVGAHIDLAFTPNSLVVADTIGLTQTVNTQRSTVAGGKVNNPSSVGARNAALSLTSGDTGRAVDQGDPNGDTIPNTNPLYAVENSAGSISATLTDVGAMAGFGTHGYRKKRPNGTFDVANATLNDTPSRSIAFIGQQWRQTFEATALVLNGPMRNTYLGSVEWGWLVNAAGNCTLDPKPIRLVRAGVPSAEFMAAATVWNAATFTDPTTGKVRNTVDLPTTSRAVLGSGHDIAKNKTTRYLLALIAVIDFEITNIATGAEVKNKKFEKLALETELLKRSAEVSVTVNETEDWLGADEVYMDVSSHSGTFRTSVQDLNDGEHHTFKIPLSKLWSIGHVAEPIRVKVFDEDVGTFVDQDDLIVDMLWPSPFDNFSNTRSFDGADYDVLLKF